MIGLVSLLVLLAAVPALGQSTPPTFGANTQTTGAPTDPTYPANFGFYQPSGTAINKLNKYSHFIEITMASNSFDYVFGAYPGAVGINDYLSGLQSGKYTPQQYPSNPSNSRQLSTTYPCLPYDFQGMTRHNIASTAEHRWLCKSDIQLRTLPPSRLNLIIVYACLVLLVGRLHHVRSQGAMRKQPVVPGYVRAVGQQQLSAPAAY